jgi:signal transduction histidine kinase
VRVGVGWREGLVGSVKKAELDPQAVYTLRSGEPVVVEDLDAEQRFGPAPVLREHGVVSAVSVVIPGRDRPFGVLGAYATSFRIFSENDVNFLQAVANVLATAVERTEAEQERREVREAERSRMARDLHDEALGDLSYALAEAQLVQSMSGEEETTQRLERLVEAIKRAGHQLRGAVYDLRLGAEQDRPFAELLEDLLELHRTMATDCEIDMENQDGVLAGPLGRTGREILRIIGEALTNARRHSQASHVAVVVGSTEDGLWAEVRDDGRGFDPAQAPTGDPSSGMGTRGMRERARAVGGDLRVESAPGEGTRVRFELALKRARAEPEQEVRVLLVEDHVVVREAIAAAFEREAGFEVVGQAASPAEARAIIGRETGAVDVALVDLGLPDGYGGT